MRRSGYTATPFDFDAGTYNALQREMGFTAGSLAEPGVLDPYMDPYYQQVVDIEKREAARQADMRNAQLGLSAAGQGSLGGYREGIERSENERNLMQLQGDIQARGSQDAYRQALTSFEADRSARGLQEQFGQGQFGLNEQARQRAAELMQQGYSLNEAARQAQEEFAQSQYGLNQQALQAREGFKQSAFGMTESAKQTQADISLAAYSAYEQAKQEASRLGLSAQQIEQAGQIAAANILLGQDQNRLAATGMLGDFALQRQGMEYERIDAMRRAGMMERGLMQQGLDIGYEDFLRQQNWGWDQLGQYSNILQGIPYAPSQTRTTYNQQPSSLSQGIGALTGAAGAYSMYR